MLSTADAAVAMARRLGDADALVAALAAAQHARWRPGRAAERLPIAAELIELSEARGSAGRGGGGPPLARGGPARALPARRGRRALARYGELAEETQQYALLINRDALRAMRALLEGDYAGGEAAAREVLEWGSARRRRAALRCRSSRRPMPRRCWRSSTSAASSAG